MAEVHEAALRSHLGRAGHQHGPHTALIVANEKDIGQPGLRVGQGQELGWAATFRTSPYARFISGHTLEVDGANWQRRSLTNPPVVTVRDQMGKGPFEAWGPTHP